MGSQMKIDQLKPHNKAKPLKPTTTLNGAEVETWDVVAQSPVSKRVRVGVCVCDREGGGGRKRGANPDVTPCSGLHLF